MSYENLTDEQLQARRAEANRIYLYGGRNVWRDALYERQAIDLEIERRRSNAT